MAEKQAVAVPPPHVPPPKGGQEGPEVLWEVRGPVGLITFNRPQARNALTFGMYDRLSEICSGSMPTARSRRWF